MPAQVTAHAAEVERLKADLAFASEGGGLRMAEEKQRVALAAELASARQEASEQQAAFELALADSKREVRRTHRASLLSHSLSLLLLLRCARKSSHGSGSVCLLMRWPLFLQVGRARASADKALELAAAEVLEQRSAAAQERELRIADKQAASAEATELQV